MIFGRSATLEYLARSDRAVTLVAADAGVGKSAVLEELATVLDGPSPVTIRRGPGALQQGILESLIATVERLQLSENGALRLARLISTAASRAAESRIRDVRKAVGALFLDVLRSRLGDSIGNAVEDIVRQLGTAADEQLIQRLYAAGNTDVVHTLIEFALEVQKFLDSGQTLVIPLDNLERLDQDDVSRLADLAERLPPLIRIVGAVSGRNPACGPAT